jgi:hypothetical protein
MSLRREAAATSLLELFLLACRNTEAIAKAHLLQFAAKIGPTVPKSAGKTGGAAQENQ